MDSNIKIVRPQPRVVCTDRAMNSWKSKQAQAYSLPLHSLQTLPKLNLPHLLILLD